MDGRGGISCFNELEERAMLSELAAPGTAALPLAEFRSHLRLGYGFADDGAGDVVLEGYLRAALAAVETRLGLALLEREFLWTLQAWSGEDGQAFPLAPVALLETVTLLDRSGAQVPFAGTWALQRDLRRPRLVPGGASLPVIATGGSVEIRFRAGFGDWGDLPADLRQAILILAARFFEQRSAGDDVLPRSVMALLMPYCDIRIGSMR